jgi:hypothetical protein
MEWQELKPNNLPKQNSWVLITNGIEWEKSYITHQFEFVREPNDKLAYDQSTITHWMNIELPS